MVDKRHHMKKQYILKLIDRLRATHWTPPDYWQTIPVDW